MNFYNHHNSISFKSHSISVTFKFCAVLVALRALEPCSTDSLGTQHCANFESHSNRVTFETNAIRMTSSVQALCSYVPEVVRSHKPLVTDRAYEVFLAGVCPCVSGQFVGSSKTFATPQPGAGKWSFS